MQFLFRISIATLVVATCFGKELTRYVVQIQNVKLLAFDESYMDVTYKDFEHENRRVINHTMEVYQDLPTDTNVKIFLYAYFHKKYHRTSMNFRGTLCDFINTDYAVLFYNQYKKFGKYWPLECPLKKGFYYLTNWYFTEDVPLPNLMDGLQLGFDSGMVEVQFGLQGLTILHYKMYLKVNGTGFGFQE